MSDEVERLRSECTSSPGVVDQLLAACKAARRAFSDLNGRVDCEVWNGFYSVNRQIDAAVARAESLPAGRAPAPGAADELAEACDEAIIALARVPLLPGAVTGTVIDRGYGPRQGKVVAYFTVMAEAHHWTPQECDRVAVVPLADENGGGAIPSEGIEGH